MSAFDAILLLSFGGPEGPDDVMPFLRNVVRGRNVPDERLVSVAHHYELFGGVSPINEQNRQLIRALRHELSEHKVDLPVYWGNRNWHPMLEDTVAQMARDGVRRALAFATSAYSSYSSCRQYLEDIECARLAAGGEAPAIEKIKPFYCHPGFIKANLDRLEEALSKLDAPSSDDVHAAFSAHSIPQSMAMGCRYQEQLTAVAQMVASRAGISDWKLVYQSRSGPANVPWLEPDINDHLRSLHEAGKEHVVVAPIGFVSDHMEVKYDLDTEAASLAAELGMNMVRAGTVGTHPSFVSMIRELIVDHLQAGKVAEKPFGCSETSMCETGCCLYQQSQVRSSSAY